ncbi:MAG: PAS domain-containing protein [Candidatus Hydrogenedentes bacterium]|nr:PAS domain-containing protein [Candidatus Hydrogenedentota bacterium]
MGPTAASFAFFAAASLLGGSGIYIILHIPYTPHLTPVVISSACLLIFSQFLNILDELAFMSHLPFIGRNSFVYIERFDDLLLFFSLGLLFMGCYLALIDGALMRAKLVVESAAKTAALEEVQRYARALRHSEARAIGQISELERLYETAPVGLCLLDHGLHFIKVNARLTDMDGIPAELHLEKRPSEVLPELGAALEGYCAAVLASDHPLLNVELACLDRPDRCAWWLVSFYKVAAHGDDDGDGVQMVVQDITDLKEAQHAQRELELQVQHAQKLESLGVLAGGIAHDFNNLLTMILASTSMALELDQAEGRLARLLQNIEGAAGRAATLTHQLLAYTGHGELQMQPVALSQLVDDLLPILHASINKKSRLTVAAHDSERAIDGDPRQLQQVIMNLVINASEAIGDHDGLIQIRTGCRFFSQGELMAFELGKDRCPRDYVYLEVEDSGCGIPEEMHRRIFDPFFTTKFTGRGLGLAVALGIIRRHVGSAAVESELGKGTIFRAIFPVGVLGPRKLSTEPEGALAG